uniref:Ubiquitin-like protease family profile domain-containing protein n=1 Tax=Arundo donax TaxID=35708 RepID=A0A0A9BBU3_ARUDO
MLIFQLFFPICYNDHWFLFVVDLENKFFLFLDSYYSKSVECYISSLYFCSLYV